MWWVSLWFRSYRYPINIVAIKKLWFSFFFFLGLSGKFGKQSLRSLPTIYFFFNITVFLYQNKIPVDHTGNIRKFHPPFEIHPPPGKQMSGGSGGEQGKIRFITFQKNNLCHTLYDSMLSSVVISLTIRTTQVTDISNFKNHPSPPPPPLCMIECRDQL